MKSFDGKVAITGGVAEGKSTVVAQLNELGYRTVSSDDLAEKVFHSKEAQSALADLLGKPTPVSRVDVRDRIWSDPVLRRAVNRIMHPAILGALEDSQAQFLEIPLLVETCLQGHFPRVWVVTCGAEEQHRRLSERIGDPKKAREIIAAQLPTEVKLAFADVIVRTNRPAADVNSFVAAMAVRSVPQ
jgi:dephospho-CoA kinase